MKPPKRGWRCWLGIHEWHHKNVRLFSSGDIATLRVCSRCRRSTAPRLR